MATPSQVAADLVSLLGVSINDLDTNVGTVTRKIIDAVANVVSEASTDQYLLSYQYDIDAKSGADLDAMVALFGFTRLPARRAVGEVTFARTTPASAPILISSGTQVSTADGGVLFVTTMTSLIPQGSSSTSVACQAMLAGSNGNVGASTITTMVQMVSGISTVANIAGFAGGVDQESDEALRARFKATVFRNMAGTEGQYLGTALDDPDAYAANVVGSSVRWREMVQFTADANTVTSSVPDATYIVPNSVALGVDLTRGNVYAEHTYYEFDDSVTPPTITRVSSDLIPDDALLELEFSYLPECSRNDPTVGITNRVDVFVAGQRPIEADETLAFSVTRVFSDTSSDAYYVNNYLRSDGVTRPTAGHFFIPYSFVPVLDAGGTDEVDSGTITIDAVTYIEGTHYWLVRDDTNTGGTPGSAEGIELAPGALATPVDGSTFAVSYIYNDVPASVTTAIANWRLLCQDVKVHAARILRLNVNLVVVPTSNATQAQADIFTALNTLFMGSPMGGTLQASDILQAAHSPSTVDAVRFATDVDNPTLYAIQSVTPNGALIDTYAAGSTPRRASDLWVPADTVVTLNAVNIIIRSPNNFGSS